MFKNIVIALAGILLLFYAFTAFAATNLSTYKPSTGTNLSTYKPSTGTNLSTYTPSTGTNLSTYKPSTGTNLSTYKPSTGTNLSTYKPSTAVNTSNLDGLYYSYVAEDKNDWLSCTDISCGSNYSSGNNYSYDYTYDYTYTKTTTTTTCSNQCSIVGQRQCSGNGYQECYKGSDGCLHWGSTNNCGTNQKCVNGSCIYFETCTDECSISGKRECSGNGYRTCGNYDSDSCKEWSTVTNCASDETCSNGSCVKKPPVCTDECSVSGQRTCSGNGFKTCSKGSDGCFHWGAVTNCSTDEYCSNGSCIEKQINICSDTLSGSPSSREQNLCSAAGGTMQCGNGWCKCNCEKPQPTVNLTSSGNATCSERAKLTWTSTNATSCTASNGWSGSKSTSGSEELGQFTGSKTFTLKCTGAGGTATDSVTITGTEDQLDVDAGDDDDVDAGDYITLDGSVDGDYDSISWSCNGGNLSNKNSLRAKLDTDENDGGDTITCTLTAKNECGSDSDSVKIKVKETTTDFNVTLEADPTSGCAPLRDVDLKARLTNASSSDIDYTYYFDCESDGDWDKTITTSAKSYTAANVCDFANVGSYTAKVKVTGKGRTVTDSETIRANNCSTPVYEKAGNVSITKNVRNVSSGTGYMGTVSAIPGNTVSYRIVVTAVDGNASNVMVRDAMPAGITNIGNVMLDGMVFTGTNLESGMNIGNLAQGQSKTITFDATVASEANFPYGQSTLTNTATVTVDGGTANSSAAVQVYRRAVQGATIISTGFDGTKYAGMGLGIAVIILGLAWAAFALLGKKKIGAEALLAQKIARIREQNGIA